MITRVQVKNYRSLADVDVTLGPLTVLVGRNGAGKSAFVDVLRFVHDVTRGDLSSAWNSKRGGFHSVRRLPQNGEAHNIEITVHVEDKSLKAVYSFELGANAEGVYVEAESCEYTNMKTGIKDSFVRQKNVWKVLPPIPFDMPLESQQLALSSLKFVLKDLTHLVHLVGSANFLTVYPNTLRKLQPIELDEQKVYSLREDGENLASVLRWIQNETSQFPNILAALKVIVDDITDIRVQSIGGYYVLELQHALQNGQKEWLNLSQESDGTLRALAILTALYLEVPFVLTAIDEPEIALYPGALTTLSEVIREATLRQQIILTTQSPDFISCFKAEELRVVEKTEGITQIGPVNAEQIEILNRNLFSSGDLLRIEGLYRVMA